MYYNLCGDVMLIILLVLSNFLSGVVGLDRYYKYINVNLTTKTSINVNLTTKTSKNDSKNRLPLSSFNYKLKRFLFKLASNLQYLIFLMTEEKRLSCLPWRFTEYTFKKILIVDNYDFIDNNNNIIIVLFLLIYQ